jgi:hypothetical protein
MILRIFLPALAGLALAGAVRAADNSSATPDVVRTAPPAPDEAALADAAKAAGTSARAPDPVRSHRDVSGGFAEIGIRGALDSGNDNAGSVGFEFTLGRRFGAHELYTGVGLSGWFSQGTIVDPVDGKQLKLSRTEWTIPVGYRFNFEISPELTLRFGPCGGVIFESMNAYEERDRKFRDDCGDPVWEAVTFGGYSRGREVRTRHDDVATRCFYGGDVALAFTPNRSASIVLSYGYREYGARTQTLGANEIRFDRTREHLFMLSARAMF